LRIAASAYALPQDGVSAAVVFGELAHTLYSAGQTLQQVHEARVQMRMIT
jgi:hypothetical protein